MDRHGGARPSTGIMLAFICLFLLGLMPVISNGRPAGTGALVFALWLSVWQFLFSLPLLIMEWRSGNRGIFARQLPGQKKTRTAAITLFTGALFGLSTWLYVLAFEKNGAVNAAIALQAYPLFAAGLEALFLGRRKRFGEWGFMVMIVGSLYYLATRGTWRLESLSAWFFVALMVPIIWSVAHIILRQALVTTPITPNQVTASRLLVSTAVLLLLALTLDGPRVIAAGMASAGFQAFAVMMGLAYYLELITWFNAVRHIEVSVASSITVPAPVVTMILAVTLLGDRILGFQIAVASAVILGLLGLIYLGARAASPQSSGHKPD